jgi:hypothetical protein
LYPQTFFINLCLLLQLNASAGMRSAGWTRRE